MKQTVTTTRTEALDQPQFTNLNAMGENLDFIQASSPEILLTLIKSIRMPTKVISIYAYANLHIAWILTTAKIKKG